VRVKAIVLWWLIKGEEHPALTQNDKKISNLMPLIQALFPGMNYFSNTGFHAVMNAWVIPALWRQFPELATRPASHLRASAMFDIREVMPCNGYEWQTREWQERFKTYARAGRP
jgi:hypothetical protein